MKREKVIELLMQSGIWTDDCGDAMGRSNVGLAVEFARLVELETLERAAEKLEAQHTWITNIAASALIRNMKVTSTS